MTNNMPYGKKQNKQTTKKKLDKSSRNASLIHLLIAHIFFCFVSGSFTLAVFS